MFEIDFTRWKDLKAVVVFSGWGGVYFVKAEKTKMCQYATSYYCFIKKIFTIRPKISEIEVGSNWVPPALWMWSWVVGSSPLVKLCSIKTCTVTCCQFIVNFRRWNSQRGAVLLQGRLLLRKYWIIWRCNVNRAWNKTRPKIILQWKILIKFYLKR